MKTIVFILWFLVLYFLFRSIKRMFLSGRKRNSANSNIFSQKKSKIDKQNVIDADYEDVTEKDESNKN